MLLVKHALKCSGHCREVPELYEWLYERHNEPAQVARRRAETHLGSISSVGSALFGLKVVPVMRQEPLLCMLEEDSLVAVQGYSQQLLFLTAEDPRSFALRP